MIERMLLVPNGLKIPKRGFTQAEFELRTARAQRIMQRNGFDALLLTAPPNVRYFTGFDSQFWESPTRPWFIIVPLEGAPIAVIPEIGAPEMALTWLKDIRTWPAPVPEDDGLSLLTSTIRGIPRKFGKIGAEIVAVDGINLDVPAGQSVAFIGPNGAGKSTTIKMLTGILHPTSGEASAAAGEGASDDPIAASPAAEGAAAAGATGAGAAGEGPALDFGPSGTLRRLPPLVFRVCWILTSSSLSTEAVCWKTRRIGRIS